MTAYRGATAVLATKHGKLGQVAAPLGDVVGLRVVDAEVDTDLLGTFTGEVPRARPPLETAVAKARMGMDATGCPLGLASEGSFTGHPAAPWLAVHTELLVLVDDTRADAAGRPLVVVEGVTTLETNASRAVVAGDTDLADAVRAVGFPDAGVVVRARVDGPVLATGVRDRELLRTAVARARSVSGGTAVIEADLRAHHNPLRRRAIRLAADGLAARLGTPCPACGLPGYGQRGTAPGLPCRDCGTPTGETAALILGCARCPHRERRPVDRTGTDPAACPYCNP